MNILLTGCNDKQAPIANLVRPALYKWCKDNNWIYQYCHCPDYFSKHPYWWKWVVVQNNCLNADLVMWLDVDVMVINPEVRLPELSGWLISFSQDPSGLCCGAFLAQGRSWLREFAAILLTIGPDNPIEREQDQALVKHLSKWGQYKKAFGLLPTSTVASRADGDPICNLPLFYHLWANDGVDITCERIKAAQYALAVPSSTAETALTKQPQ